MWFRHLLRFCPGAYIIHTMSRLLPMSSHLLLCASDSQLYIAINHDDILMKLNLLRNCTMAVNDWFLSNGLSFNPDKSEVLLLSISTKLWTIGAVGQVSVADALINLSDSIKNLGLLLDFEFTFNKHVDKVCQMYYFHIMDLRRVQGSLSPDVANTEACTIVGTRLDYCNFILYGTSKNNISQL